MQRETISTKLQPSLPFLRFLSLSLLFSVSLSRAFLNLLPRNRCAGDTAVLLVSTLSFARQRDKNIRVRLFDFRA